MTHVVGKPAPSSQRLKQLGMPAVLVIGAIVTQNSQFSLLEMAIAIASTHWAYPRRDGQADLTWVAVIY